MCTSHVYSAVQDDAINVSVLIEIPICTAALMSQFSSSSIQSCSVQSYSWHSMV